MCALYLKFDSKHMTKLENYASVADVKDVITID